MVPEREPAGDGGVRRYTTPYERRDEWREPRWGRVDKWDIHFDGDPDPAKLTVEDFVFRVEFLQRQSRRSWDEVLDNFHHLVRGRAAEWYWQFVRERPPEVWEDLKDELVSRFRAVGGQYERLRALNERRQEPGESVEDYFRAMRKLAARLITPIADSEMVRVVKKGLEEEIARYVYAIRVRNLEQLREECVEVEHLFRRRERRSAFRPTLKFQQSGKRVEEIEPESEELLEGEEEVMVEETHLTAKPRLGCWNCGEVGHGFRECMAKERRVFCYLCGRPETYTPKCPNCSGNSRTGMMKAGYQSSGRKPARK
ncbi:uncharacterized protein LOC117591728 [Drosophila guanche]|uniref:uncharacterized protein LOC117591728 n=1 Tax=Drosophila guanche TaxID=7266 RepID=UPI00147198B2|nr:uncharacterized protein LOC117591728 [Drosophila guanche]